MLFIYLNFHINSLNPDLFSDTIFATDLKNDVKFINNSTIVLVVHLLNHPRSHVFLVICSLIRGNFHFIIIIQRFLVFLRSFNVTDQNSEEDFSHHHIKFPKDVLNEVLLQKHYFIQEFNYNFFTFINYSHKDFNHHLTIAIHRLGRLSDLRVFLVSLLIYWLLLN